MRSESLQADARILAELERKVLWLAAWTIHNANHLRESSDGLKVGGHQASSASLVTIMTALYFAVLRPADRVAVKPHASPVFHAIQYLLGNQTREKLQNFRGFGFPEDIGWRGTPGWHAASPRRGPPDAAPRNRAPT